MVMKNKFKWILRQFIHHVGGMDVGVERILFQTGDYRMENKIQKYKSGSGIIPGYDEPDSEQPVDEAVFCIRNFSTEVI